MKRLLGALIAILLMYASLALGQTYDTKSDDHGGGTYTSEETSTGYNYYDQNNKLVGTSERDGSGGYSYYDKSGNYTGSVSPDKYGGYTSYDDRGIQAGTLENTPSNKYDYKSRYEGGTSEYDVSQGNQKDVGALNPFAQENNN
jgi:hypothetical protein